MKKFWSKPSWHCFIQQQQQQQQSSHFPIGGELTLLFDIKMSKMVTVEACEFWLFPWCKYKVSGGNEDQELPLGNFSIAIDYFVYLVHVWKYKFIKRKPRPVMMLISKLCYLYFRKHGNESVFFFLIQIQYYLYLQLSF